MHLNVWWILLIQVLTEADYCVEAITASALGTLPTSLYTYIIHPHTISVKKKKKKKKKSHLKKLSTWVKCNVSLPNCKRKGHMKNSFHENISDICVNHIHTNSWISVLSGCVQTIHTHHKSPTLKNTVVDCRIWIIWMHTWTILFSQFSQYFHICWSNYIYRSNVIRLKQCKTLITNFNCNYPHDLLKLLELPF